MAQKSLPAVLLLLLGFVEAVDIKGNSNPHHRVHPLWFCWSSGGSESPFSLSLDFFSPPRPRISFSKCNEFLLQIHFFAVSFFGPFVSVGDASRLQRMRFPISTPSLCLSFSPKPFSLIPTLPLIPNPRVLARISICQQSSASSPMSRTNQIVVTGLNDAWAPSCYFPVKLGQLLRLDIRASWALMKIHKSRRIKTRAMASSLHNPRFLVSAKPCSMSVSSLKSRRWRNNNLESRWKKFNQRGSLELVFPLKFATRNAKRCESVENDEYIGSTRYLESENLSRN